MGHIPIGHDRAARAGRIAWAIPRNGCFGETCVDRRGNICVGEKIDCQIQRVGANGHTI